MIKRYGLYTLSTSFLFIVFVLFLNFYIIRPSVDDLTYAKVTSPLFDFLKQRYLNWTSRTLTDVLVISFTQAHILCFALLNTAILLSQPLLLAFCVSGRKNFHKALFPSLCLMLMYPYYDMSTAGWQTTFIENYWTVTALFVSIAVLRKQREEGKVSLYFWAAAAICCILACNKEQIALCVLILSLICAFLWRKSCPSLVKLGFFISFASLIYHFLAPGNVTRTFAETRNWMPEFANFTIYEKLYEGFISSSFYFFFSVNFIYIAFLSILVISACAILRKPQLILLSALPFFFIIVSTPYLSVIHINIFPYHMLASLQYDAIWQYIIYLFSVFSIVSIFVLLFAIICIKIDAAIVLSSLSVSLIQRFAMGTTPLIYASNTRTFILMYFGFICTAIYIFVITADELDRVWHKVLYFSFFALACCGFLNNCALLIATRA